MQFLLENPSTPFQFVSDHIHMVGWGTVMLVMLRAIWLSFKIGSYTFEVKSKAEEVYTQTTNHMPHSLDRIDRNIALLVSLKGAKPVLPGDEE